MLSSRKRVRKFVDRKQKNVLSSVSLDVALCFAKGRLMLNPPKYGSFIFCVFASRCGNMSGRLGEQAMAVQNTIFEF